MTSDDKEDEQIELNIEDDKFVLIKLGDEGQAFVAKQNVTNFEAIRLLSDALSYYIYDNKHFTKSAKSDRPGINMYG